MQPSPFSGFGLGMRVPHYSAFVAGSVPVDFIEVISENFMVAGGRPLHVLDTVRSHYPVALHGVSMSIGRTERLDPEYLSRLKALAARVDPLWVSDHLCWTGVAGFNSHDLLPVPLTEEALARCATNILEAQDALGRAMLIENPSSYITFAADHISEWDFLVELTKRTGCCLLLDINNIFVSSHNHGFDPNTYLNAIPTSRVRQIHLAGHSAGRDGLLIDTHDHPVPDPVWSLYAAHIGRFNDVAVMIERDDDIPPLDELLGELDHARALARCPTSVAATAVASTPAMAA